MSRSKDDPYDFDCSSVPEKTSDYLKNRRSLTSRTTIPKTSIQNESSKRRATLQPISTVPRTTRSALKNVLTQQQPLSEIKMNRASINDDFHDITKENRNNDAFSKHNNKNKNETEKDKDELLTSTKRSKRNDGLSSPIAATQPFQVSEPSLLTEHDQPSNRKKIAIPDTLAPPLFEDNIVIEEKIQKLKEKSSIGQSISPVAAENPQLIEIKNEIIQTDNAFETSSTNANNVVVLRSSTAQTEGVTGEDQSVQASDHQFLPHTRCLDIRRCPCAQLTNTIAQLLTTFLNQIRPTLNQRQRQRRRFCPYRRRIRYQQQIREQNSQQNISEIADVIPQFVPSTVNEVEDTAQNIGEMTFSNRSTMVSDTQQLLDEKRKILIDNGECEHITELTSSEIALLSEEQLSSSPEPLDLRKEEKKKMTVLACTSLNDQQKEKLHEFMQYFNCQSSLFIDETTTHLITSEQDETLACPLTGKVIQAVARHLFVVSYRWIIECLKQERLVSEDDYEIRGDLTFDKQHNGMNRSRTNSTQLLLENYAFLLKCSGYGPFDDNRPIIEMIELCGGIVLNNLTTDVNGIKRQIIILCSNDYKPNNLIMGACKRLNAQCLKTQWLLLSIVRFKIQSCELHQI